MITLKNVYIPLLSPNANITDCTVPASVRLTSNVVMISLNRVPKENTRPKPSIVVMKPDPTKAISWTPML